MWNMGQVAGTGVAMILGAATPENLTFSMGRSNWIATTYDAIGTGVGAWQTGTHFREGQLEWSDAFNLLPFAPFAFKGTKQFFGAAMDANGTLRSWGRMGVSTLWDDIYEPFPLFRRDKNVGAFQDLEVPMQQRTVKKVAKQAGIGLDKIKVKIVRDPELIGRVYGYTPPSGKEIQLYPSAFENYESLVKTLGHERTHVYQVKISGATNDAEELFLREKAAYGSEDTWWDYYRVNNNQK